MSETGGIDIGMPSEGQSGAPEQLSEEAKQRFAAAAAAMQALQREEKKSKKRDSKVARTIIRFLNDERYAHLFVLISRLVARDCPSVFILAILSLIDEECMTVCEEFLQEAGQKSSTEMMPQNMALTQSSSMDENTSTLIVQWITRMQMVLSLDVQNILDKLLIDEENMDGTVLQLATFVVQDFMQRQSHGKTLAFEQLHVFTGSVLQSVFEPFMELYVKKVLPPSKDVDE